MHISSAYFCSLPKLSNFDLRKGGKWFSSNKPRHRCYPFYTHMKRICLQRVYIGNIEPQSKAFPLCKSKVESKSNLPEGRENLYRIWRRLNSVWFPTSHYHLILRSYALFLLNNTFYVFYWIMYQNPEVNRFVIQRFVSKLDLHCSSFSN